MAKGIFTTKIDPTYDDLPEERYHFPRTYLSAAEQTVGDWVIYYEPRRSSGAEGSRGGRQAYFATARVTSIERDPTRLNHFYAFVADYLEFDHSVPFRDGEIYYESALRRPEGGTSTGPFRRAVRVVPDHEFDLILQTGYAPTLADAATNDKIEKSSGLSEGQLNYRRPIVERVVARPFRDASFARHIKVAYDRTCAVTGLRLINGGGRAEVQAAHIRPVAAEGPDSVRNGLALSGTVHWMFDRGLISVDENYTILTAHDRVPDAVERLINVDRRLRLPTAPGQRPHEQFLRFHREQVFKP